MGIKNHNFGTNRMGGTGIGSQYGQGLYAESSTAKFPIGEKLELSDGRVFRYGKTAAAVAAGILVSQDLSATSLVETDDAIPVEGGQAAGFSTAAGSTQVQITLASVTEDQFAGALLQITDDAGEGIQYRIKSNSATDASSSGEVDFYLFDPIHVAVSNASDVAIVGGLWYDVIAATSTSDYVIAGVTTIAMTSGYYGWLQTAGIATILSDGTIAIGGNLTLSDSTAGAVHAKDAETEPLVGFAAYAPDSTGHVGVVIQGLVA